jgi:hypothetical protein
MGNANAPDSPWGRDEIDVFDDGRLVYRNQRGARARGALGSLEAGVAERLFAALAASPFPRASGAPIPPGSSLVELRYAGSEGEATVLLDYHAALKSPGYDVVVEMLARWAALLRSAPGKRTASNEVTGIVDEFG